MKKLLLILLCLPMIGFGQLTYVPDDNFEAYLEANGMGNGISNDDSVLTANINTITHLSVFALNIADLTGIEDFSALTHLMCDVNQLTSLDVSNNTALTYLECWSNQLTSLDVSNNPALEILWCEDNQLTSLDVTSNISLTNLSCFSNQLTSLDVSNNPDLDYLECSWNQLTSLDVSQNINLAILSFADNQITSLDVSQNTVLTSLACGENQLTSLDLRNGNNINTTLWAQYNPELYCINVDDVAWSTANWTVFNNSIDSTMFFSTDCATEVFGCVDSIACNYNAFATISDSSCIYHTSSYDTLFVSASIVWNGMNLNISGDYSYILTNSAGCDSTAYLNLTITNTTGVIDLINEKQIVKITNMLGQETPYRRNTPLFYIYDDGTVEKRITID